MTLKDHMPNKEKTLKTTVVINTIALWGGAIALAVYFIQGGIAFGTERTRIDGLESSVMQMRTEMRQQSLDLWEKVGQHENSEGHSIVLQALAANEERDKAIKESLDEIKEDLKTLIRERRN